ncbi:MAG: lactonase family protein [Lentisphaerales bacterium]|nr:lactonase family protein [Lentisphaerales bacterium]
MRFILTGFLLVISLTAVAEMTDILFIGTRIQKKAEGIYAVDFNRKSGEVKNNRLIAKFDAFSLIALSHDKKTLYTSGKPLSKGQQKKVSAYRIQPDTSLKLLNSINVEGSVICDLNLSGNGKFLVTGDYGHGYVCSFSLNKDGSLGQQVSRFEIPKNDNGKARAHAAYFTPDSKWVLVSSIANQTVYALSFNHETGELVQKGKYTSESLRGPRHLTVSENGQYIYVVNQGGSDVVVLEFDGNGKFEEKQVISALPENSDIKTSAAEILLHPSGKFLYTSNRGHNSIAVFKVQESGLLKSVEIEPCGGPSPWSFVISPDGKFLISGNLSSNQLQVFSINPVTGELKIHGKPLEVPEPVCLRF